MSVKHPKGRRMGAFDCFIDDCVLVRCREINGENIGEPARKYLSKKLDTREFRFLSSIFYFRISFLRL